MNLERLNINKPELPQGDKRLARLYALSQIIKRSEQNTTLSQIEVDGKKTKNINSNQFFMNAFGQISFITPGCRLGQCSFCSYGAGKKNLTPKVVEEEMDKFIRAIFDRNLDTKEYDVRAILLDSVGSILDYNEFSPECLDKLFEKLEELIFITNQMAKDKGTAKISSIGFETHYQTLGSYDENGNYTAKDAVQKLIEFKRQHPEIETFVVELGFETSNNAVRDNLLFKHIDDETYKKSVQLLHENGIEVEVNVMATLPFLTQSEQIDQSTKSIIDALTSYEDGGFGVDSVTLFPLNVRKHTFCEYAFNVQEDANAKNHTQSPDFMQKEFPIWSMVATLNNLIEMGRGDLLERVSVAWFGGRQLSDDGSEKFPEDSEITYDDFVEYRKNIPGKRVEIIQKLAKHPKFLEFQARVNAARQEEQRKMGITPQTTDEERERIFEEECHRRVSYLYDLISATDVPYEQTPCQSSKTMQ